MIAAILGAPKVERARLADALDAVGCKASFESDAQQLRGMLDGDSLRCVLAFTPGDVREASRALREGQPAHLVPIIAVAELLTDRTMSGLLGLGADDIVAKDDVTGLVRRTLVAMTIPRRIEPPTSPERCLLVHHDAQQRHALGSVLRNAGYDVRAVASAQEVCSATPAPGPVEVILVAEDLPPDGGRAAILPLSRALGSRTPIALLVESGFAGARKLDDVVMIPARVPPSDLLFMVHDLRHPRGLRDVRASQRVLHTTLCMFAPEGELFERSYGLTYNISAEGLYIRTLDAPVIGKGVRLALRSPGDKTGSVQLGGTVVWGSARLLRGASASPPGFGVRLSVPDCAPNDLARYQRGYEHVLKALR